MDNKLEKVVMVGLGYIGLPTAALMASKKFNVLGVDITQSVVDTINNGEIHIVEPDLSGIVKDVVSKKTLKAATVPDYADVFMIAVPTPFKEGFQPDISYVENATRAVIPFLKEGNLFIIESTSPIGTTQKMRDIIFEERPELINKIYISYCPERVLPGKVIYELEHNDRVIGGIDEASSQITKEFYRKIVSSNLYVTNSQTAEMCKLVENSSRDVSIAFANELSIICDKADINVWELIELANKHPRVNILTPGTGVGGHCIAVDPWFIVADYPEEATMIRTAREINSYKTLWVIEKVKNEILTFNQKENRQAKVALMGLAFKPNIDDLRESPAIQVVKALKEANLNADYSIVEPNISGGKENHYLNVDLSTYKTAYNSADIVVFLVGHKEFKDLIANESTIELDFCGIRE
ncbi:MAG: UDP-N-acetyl-D-mannosaminuronic acid dehydrogenase [Crocinitomix sp.]|jgi:UDP-N-acetyl-D-mannosaminuronic acid dehydrogenase